MTSSSGDHLIAPSLFSQASNYARSLLTRANKQRNLLTKTTPIVVFCENFFLQFFERVLHKDGMTPGPASKETAIELRRGLQGVDGAAPTRRVIAAFEELCDTWGDIRAGEYGQYATSPFDEFNGTYIPVLLERILQWSKGVDDDELKAAIAKAREDYGKVARALKH